MSIDCQDCNGTGLIEVQSITLGGAIYDKEKRGMIHPYLGRGDWKQTICPCLSDRDD